MDVRRFHPWVIRAGWLALPFAAGPAFGAALHPHSAAVRLASLILLWGVWAAVLVGTLAPWPIGLTALRLAAPSALVAAVVAAASGRPSTLAGAGAVAITGFALLVAMAPETAVVYVNGSAYPNERRYPLRPPGALLLGPLELSWVVVVGAPVVGILLLAARNWVAGAIVLALGLPAAVVLARSLHNLSRRWVVFVPAGVVLHDPLSLLEPALFPRRSIETLRPAPADSDSLDLTHGAMGLTLELLLVEKIDMTRAKPGKRFGEQGASARLLFNPTRPGQVLAEAIRRHVPVA